MVAESTNNVRLHCELVALHISFLNIQKLRKTYNIKEIIVMVLKSRITFCQLLLHNAIKTYLRSCKESDVAIRKISLFIKYSMCLCDLTFLCELWSLLKKRMPVRS